MPVYDYECKKCKHAWSVEQKINDPKIEECPSCKEKEAKRLISLGNFVLKGSGWFNSGGY